MAGSRSRKWCCTETSFSFERRNEHVAFTAANRTCKLHSFCIVIEPMAGRFQPLPQNVTVELTHLRIVLVCKTLLQHLLDDIQVLRLLGSKYSRNSSEEKHDSMENYKKCNLHFHNVSGVPRDLYSRKDVESALPQSSILRTGAVKEELEYFRPRHVSIFVCERNASLKSITAVWR